MMHKQILLVTIIMFLAGLLCAEAYAQISVTSSLTSEREVAAGTSYDGTITLRNTSNASAVARIFQTELMVTGPGRRGYPEVGTAERSNWTWIAHTPPTLSLAPDESATVSFTVTVPGDALPGTYWSVLMVENLRPDTQDAGGTGTGEIRVGVRQVLRYAVQIITTIPGRAVSDVQISDITLVENAGGGHSLQIDLENRGTRFGRPDCWIEVFSEIGESFGRNYGCGSRVLPEGFGRSRIDLSHLPPGTYQALLVLDAGGGALSATQYTIEF